MFLNVYRYLKFLILFNIFCEIKGEYYSSVVGLENLLTMEQNFVTAVENYISNIQKVQENIESFLQELELEHKKMNESKNYYFGDPINAFSIIKRLVVDWKYYDGLIAMITEYNEFNETITIFQKNFTQPTLKDLQGAARGMSLLQLIYKLNTKEVAQGYLLDYKLSEEMKAHDCFVMGVSLFNSSEFLPASEWFLEAIRQLDIAIYEGEEDPVETFPSTSYVEVLEYLHVSLFYGGHFKLAKLMNHMLLEFDPENRIGLANKELFVKSAREEIRMRKIDNPPKKSKLGTLYAQVCSGELTQTPAEMRNLRCRYVTNNVPYYFIGPFKMEELNHDPFVVFYHETIYDGEIAEIRKIVGNNVTRSKIGNFELSEKRTSKQTWLWWNKYDFMKKLYQRLEDITGLSMKTGEAMQVVNYGIGGHYAPHYDFSATPIKLFGQDSNRILTALFYINDVELGGSTAFPFLHLAVPPIKHSLLMWYNMHESTEMDYRTRHAGCPVLKGSKWICNEWFQDLGQELKRPCGLHTVGDKYKHYYYIQ